MKTFEDLVFVDHPAKPMFDKKAELIFNDGTRMVVITGERAFTNSKEPYEVCVNGNIHPFLIKEEVNEIIKEIQQ